MFKKILFLFCSLFWVQDSNLLKKGRSKKSCVLVNCSSFQNLNFFNFFGRKILWEKMSPWNLKPPFFYPWNKKKCSPFLWNDVTATKTPKLPPSPPHKKCLHHTTIFRVEEENYKARKSYCLQMLTWLKKEREEERRTSFKLNKTVVFTDSAAQDHADTVM